MNTTYQSTQNRNVSSNERALRAIFGMGLLIFIIIGTFNAPTAIFGLSMVSIYLIFTTILGIDPVYSLAQGLAQQFSVPHPETGQACA